MVDYFNNCEDAAKKIIQHVGKKIVIAVPIALGKPVGLLNALYRLACADPSITLTIFTGLTLARPRLHNQLEKSFLNPILDRLLGNCEELLFEKARELEQLPANINVVEFFLTPGKYLRNAYVQENYISANYSNVIRDLIRYSVNVIAQQVASSEEHKESYSLSSNTDLFHGVKEYLRESERKGNKIAIVGEVNANLPFMFGDVAQVNGEVFTAIIDTKKYQALFPVPREELHLQDHMIGLYCSSLIKDDGCLQVGIGKLSVALANALIYRHQKNESYNALLNKLNCKEKFNDPISAAGETGIFNEGLYASTEMLSDEYMQIYKAGILKKKVFDHVGLQKLLNEKKITKTITPELIDILIENKIINSMLTVSDVQFLQKFGIFKSELSFKDEHLILLNGEKILADLSNLKLKNKISEACLGDHLKLGKIIHAGFFFGSVDFYEKLRNLSREKMQEIDMVTIARTNSLLWSPELLKLQRTGARFVNSSLMITLLGDVVSDALKDYQEVSGVGGQYDFVSMANQLDDARSIINCRSTRETKDGVKSNILWSYSNTTISRYLRDIIVTEYGIADCRSKTNADVIKAILNVTDSRFQEGLLNKAKKAGKICCDYQIPDSFRNNYPEAIQKTVNNVASDYFVSYPFASDLTKEEQVLARALLILKNSSKRKLFKLIVLSFFFFRGDEEFDKYLVRMDLKYPRNIKGCLYKKLLKYILNMQYITANA